MRQSVVDIAQRRSMLFHSQWRLGAMGGRGTSCLNCPRTLSGSEVFCKARWINRGRPQTGRHCGGGIAATVDAFALALLGHEQVLVYDGSLAEWVADPSLPMLDPGADDAA